MVLIKMWMSNTGYLRLWVKLPNGTRRKELYHRYVYNNTYGVIPEGYEVHHLDGNILNNTPENLVAIPVDIHDLFHSTGNIELLIPYILLREILKLEA